MQRYKLLEAELPILEWRVLSSVTCYRSTHLGTVIQRGEMGCARQLGGIELRHEASDQPRFRTVDSRRRLLMLKPTGEIMFKRVWAAARDLNAGLY